MAKAVAGLATAVAALVALVLMLASLEARTALMAAPEREARNAPTLAVAAQAAGLWMMNWLHSEAVVTLAAGQADQSADCHAVVGVGRAVGVYGAQEHCESPPARPDTQSHVGLRLAALTEDLLVLLFLDLEPS